MPMPHTPHIARAVPIRTLRMHTGMAGACGGIGSTVRTRPILPGSRGVATRKNPQPSVDTSHGGRVPSADVLAPFPHHE